MNELVSVIIPTYNSCNTLNRAIESIKMQKYSDWEIIVVDDGSSDGTREFLESQNDSIRFMFQQNLGAGPARNAGVKMANGDWIAFLDADDEWLPEKLELQINAAKSIKEFGIISTGWTRITENQSKRIGCDESVEVITYSFNDNFKNYCCLTSSVLISKEAFLDAGGFSHQWWSGEDADLWLKIAYRHPVYHLPMPLVNRYILPHSLLRRTLLLNHCNRLLIREQWWPDLPNSLDVDRKLNKEEYLRMFERVFTNCFEYFLEMNEFKIAIFAWYRYQKILNNRLNFITKIFYRVIIYLFAKNRPKHNEDLSIIFSRLLSDRSIF